MTKRISFIITTMAIFCLMLCFGMSASANNELAATGQCGDDVYWNYDSTTGELIVSGTGKMYDYPNFVDYSPFYDTDIKTVIVEEGITSIGAGAFESCESLKVATIPDGVTIIGDSAFDDCYVLTNVAIPYGVKSIGAGAFSCCYEFTSITIPDSVTSIGINAFLCCENITSIKIPDSVVTLGRGAFDRCSAVTSITIGKNVKEIGISTFNDCDKVENIYIPASVTKIESSAFSDWHSLKEFVVDENNKNYISEQGILFNKDKTQLVKYPSSKEGSAYTVPESVESFGNYGAFGHCNNLEEIVLGSKVTSLGNFIFQDCENLKCVEFVGAITTINLGSFWGCVSLDTIIIPNSVTSIESDAFRACNSFKTVSIPKNVTHIGEEAFGFCTNLENIIVDENNNYYSDDNGVLYNKDKSILVQYPAGKKDALYFVDLNVITIDEYAFAYNQFLKKVVMYSNLAEINANAFFACSKLSDVYFYGTKEMWNNIVINENNGYLFDAYIHYNIDACKHAEDGYETVVTKENTNKATYISSGSYEEVVYCKNCEREISRELKEIPQLQLTGISYSYENNVLRIFGSGRIPGNSEYPWSQYADSTKQIVLDGITSVGANAFANFVNLKSVIIDRKTIVEDDNGNTVTTFGDVEIKSGVFSNCPNLSIVVSYANITRFAIDAITSNIANPIDVNYFINSKATNKSDMPFATFEFLKTNYDLKPGVFVNGDVTFTEEEFKYFIVGMYYGSNGDFYTLKFNNFYTDEEEFVIYEYTQLDPFIGKPIEYVSNKEIALIMYYDGDNYGLTGFETFCNTIIASGDDVEYDYKLVALDNNVNDEDVEEEPSFFEAVMQTFATFFEAVKKFIKLITKLFGG